MLKALRKEPRHRYASVEQLAEDVRRYLGGHPVLAREGTLLDAAPSLDVAPRLGGLDFEVEVRPLFTRPRVPDPAAAEGSGAANPSPTPRGSPLSRG